MIHLYMNENFTRVRELIEKAQNGKLTLEETKELQRKANSVSVSCSYCLQDEIMQEVEM